MWYRIGNIIYGVLCDWDLAEVQSDGANSMPLHEHPRAASPVSPSPGDNNAPSEESDLKPRYRTGTGPFMAMDLLRVGPPPLHLYRHDLESLFYILVYACMVLDLQRKIFHRFLLWERESLLDIGHNKKELLSGDTAVYDQFFSKCQPAFLPLVDGADSWVYCLWYHFSEIECAYTDILRARKQAPLRRAPVTATKDGEGGITRDRREPEQLVMQRETEITYAKFMYILGAVQDIATA